jgi:SAM-dependent methyltransferase
MNMPVGHARNADQIAYWNGPGGLNWTSRQAAQDIMLAPVLQLLINRAEAKPGQRILDVGTGCGATAVALARQVAPSGSVLGIDISSPMLTLARQLAPKDLPVDFVLADATVHPFEPESFDLLVSRFGVMFFAEPVVSFANLRRALRPSGRLAFTCWREPNSNPWMMATLQAVYRHVSALPLPEPEDPGPFTFASAGHVNRILKESGYQDIGMQQVDLLLDVASGQGLESAVRTALGIGPSARALHGQPPELRQAAEASVRETLSPFAHGENVLLDGSIWIVTARVK